MSAVKIATFFLLSVTFTKVATWTIDLPEVRQYFFNKYDKKSDYKVNNKVQTKFFDNIQGDSPHNTDRYEDEIHYNPDYYNSNNSPNNYYSGGYADGYGYQSYMEKKVGDIVHDGSVYLEGLRLSLERYTELLQNCTRYDFISNSVTNSNSSNSTPFNFTDFSNFNLTNFQNFNSTNFSNFNSTNFPNFNSSNFSPTNSMVPMNSFSNYSNSNATWMPENERPMPQGYTLDRSTCERATRASEHVRRLSELALWATRELEDRAYADKYQKRTHDEAEEEKQLLLRLAWFLDRLAYYTGFEPDHKRYATTEPTRTTTSTPSPFSMVSAPPEVTRAMMDCLKSSTSSQPAIDRCRYPLPLPPMLRRLLNMSDDSSSPNDSQGVSPINNSASPSSTYEILVPTETRSQLSNLPPTVKFVQKRSADNPMVEVMKYYVKHKAWVNSNPNRINNDAFDLRDTSEEDFDVPNEMTAVNTVQKREKRAIDNIFPQDPMQDVSEYVRHRSGVHYVRSLEEEEKIKQFLEKIRVHSLSKNVQKAKTANHIQKRSAHYERMFLPKISQDPYQDISYYIKNKEGTEYNNNLIQAALVRANLEQIFQIPNIQVVRQYGANFIPGVADVQITGSIKSFADV